MCKKLIYFVSFVLVLGLVGNVSADLNYEYYEAPAGEQYTLLADVGFGVATPVRTGIVTSVNAAAGSWIEAPDVGGHRADDYAFRFTGYILVPVTGSITFYLRSDDGSHLYIDGTLVIDNDGAHGAEAPPGDAGTISLTAGPHTIEVTQFERGGGESLYVNWAMPGQAWEPVPDSALYSKPPVKAHDPNPADGAGDVARTPTLTWTPGEFAAPTNGHKVYFGESFNDVNDAAGGIAQDANSYTVPETLDFGQTYYWRVDEV
ncbi:MAG: hypothetical protein KAY65_15765, partial [Planctomycetes bacterium]|nr:hypothetical protein [Planctomycetota bacterium]